jgi:hypothetical protein
MTCVKSGLKKKGKPKSHLSLMHQSKTGLVRFASGSKQSIAVLGFSKKSGIGFGIKWLHPQLRRRMRDTDTCALRSGHIGVL